MCALSFLSASLSSPAAQDSRLLEDIQLLVVRLMERAAERLTPLHSPSPALTVRSNTPRLRLFLQE